ncbi:DUF3800 domain-containing protein [Baekduia sp. Peel2402]|uniref:DUF3800 domain-containing protein n=1 Tax=Baekduia sp. Peel2402 TaxID=3458296 RepID=UPI00403EBCE0
MIFFVDESGDTGIVSRRSTSWFMAGGVMIPAGRVDDLRATLAAVEREFFPRERVNAARPGVWELKGTKIRKAVAQGASAEQAHRVRYLSVLAARLATRDARLVAAIGVKPRSGQAPRNLAIKESVYSAMLDAQQRAMRDGEPLEVHHDHFRRPEEAQELEDIVARWAAARQQPVEVRFSSSARTPGIQIADQLLAGLLLLAATPALTWHRPLYWTVAHRHRRRLDAAVATLAPDGTVTVLDLASRHAGSWPPAS